MSGIPINYTAGFNSHPKISFCDPSPLGIESFAEWLRPDLKEHIKPHTLIDLLSPHLPEGIIIDSISYEMNPRKIYQQVEYEVSNIDSDMQFNASEDKFNFNIDLRRENSKLMLLLPYPQPLGIYKILERFTGLEKNSLLDLRIVKSKLSVESQSKVLSGTDLKK